MLRRVRVLLLGMGADEQMGGYGRHRTAFRQRGWGGLQEELDAEAEAEAQAQVGTRVGEEKEGRKELMT